MHPPSEMCLLLCLTKAEICMSRLCLSSVLPTKSPTIVYYPPHVCSCGAKKGELTGSRSWLSRRTQGWLCSPKSCTNCPGALWSPCFVMWSSWLCVAWSVVVSVCAVFIIAMVHLRTSHTQVLSPPGSA